jgi:cytochrome c
MKLLSILLASVVLCAAPLVHGEGDRATPDEAHALVKKAVAYYKKVGRDKAMEDFKRSPGPFVDRDLYITVYDLQGNCLAHTNPRMAGRNMLEVRDPAGKYTIRERIDLAKRKPEGSQELEWPNPVTKRVEHKTMYYVMKDNLIFSSGAYRVDN